MGVEAVEGRRGAIVLRWRMAPPPDPVLLRFRAALDDAYGARLQRVVLYGSRARGDGHETSDYDVAVFLDRIEGFGLEAGRLAVIETDLLFDTGAVVNALPLAAERYVDRTAFMAEVRRDGRDL